MQGLLGWFFIPDLPAHRAAWYLNEAEKEHAAHRLGQTSKQTWDRTVLKRVLLSWQFYLLPLIFMREHLPPLPPSQRKTTFPLSHPQI